VLRETTVTRERKHSIVASMLSASIRLLKLLKTSALYFLPTILAILYIGLFSADRYVSEAQFVVRTAAKPAGAAGFNALLQMTGLSSASDETFAVQAFMTSRSAVEQMTTQLPVREIYGHPKADPVARYPSLLFGATNEELHSYLNWMVDIVYHSTTGITTLRVQAFDPEDSRRVAETLLTLGEQRVNEMNNRIQRDAVRLAETEVSRNQERLIAAQQNITLFRNKELMIDPTGSSVVITELIARLSSEVAQLEAQIRELSAAAQDTPQLPPLRRRAEALKAQITRERERISSKDGGLADKLASYERLLLDSEFAKQSLAASVRALETAQLEARRQQLYLERVVEPIVPDKAMAPARLRFAGSVFGVNLILLMVGWLMFSGMREHGRQTH